MTYGQFSCPKCHNPGMGGYSYYESDGNGHWIFYNTETRTNNWKCWAALPVCCGFEVHHWYDPCGCCFNPCNFKTDKIKPYDTIYDIEAKEDKAWCILGCRCFFFIILCYVIYFMYFCFFIWYDIYYAFCHKQRLKKVYIGYGERTFDDNENIWSYADSRAFTEQNWINNYQSLFRCPKCFFNSNTFLDFIGNEQRAVQIANIQTDMTNAGINIEEIKNKN